MIINEQVQHLIIIQSYLSMQAEQPSLLGGKELNYKFLLLVRDQKYAQALELGRQILQANPDNPAVKKFVIFIEGNTKKLDEMVKEEEEYESVDEDDEEDGAEGTEQQAEGAQEKSEDEDSDDKDDKEEDEEQQEQEEEEIQKERPKIELTTCTLNQIPHICPRHHREQTASTTSGQSQ